MKKNPIVWIGTVFATERPMAKITNGRMRRSCHFSSTIAGARALGAVRSGSRNQIVAALISASAEMK